jgi:hypothetical protein
MKKSEEGLLVYKKALLVGAWGCLVFLSFLSPAHAGLPFVSPGEGTIGTTLTISGGPFSVKRGTVFLGSKPCQVLEWGDKAVKCFINEPMQPGTYDIRLDLQGKLPRVILPKAFTIKAPELELPTHRPHFVSPGDVVTVRGRFFGDGHGRHQVEIANLRGDKKLGRILDWAMDSITFKLPHEIPGIFHLRVTNAVGSETQPWWGTFAKPPTNPPNLLGSYQGNATHDNASAVAYNRKLYAFYPHVNDDNNYIAYRTTPDGTTWSSGSYLETGDASKVKQRSKAQINPLVADEILYVFYTGIDGKLYYLKLDFVAPEDEIVPDPRADPQTVEKVWQPAQAIPDAQVQDLENRFAAVYNFTKKWIEVYWTPDSLNVYMKTYTLATRTWSDAKPVTLPRTNTFIAPYLTAVFNQLEEGDYVTYLSYADGSAGYLAELKDGEVRQSPIKSSTWKPVDSNRGPSLADLGNDYLAVIYNRRSDRSYYQKYDKNTRTVFAQEFGTFVSEQDTGHWAPTGITFSNEVVDTESPTGFRMDTNFYVFVGNNPSGPLTNTRWQFVKCEHVGYWMPTDKEGTEISFGSLLTDTFELWPIVGMIDMPPYVENGKECLILDECDSDVDYSFKKITVDGLSVEGSAGMYMRTRARSPVEMSMSGGYTGGYDDSTTVTLKQGDKLLASRDGTIIVYYYVPTFTLTTLQWHDSNPLDTTNGLQTESARVSGAEIRKEAFNPIDGPSEWQAYWEAMSPGVFRPPYLDPAVFPCHESEVIDLDTNKERPESDLERLLTYCKNTTNYPKALSGTVTWQKDSPGYFDWEISREHSSSNGFYVDMKIGLKGKVAAGAEGSVKVLFKSKTEYGVEAITWIRGPKEYDSDPLRVTSYHLEGYWLKPNKNVYWVPEYRKTAGDQPWFITYRVTDGFTQGLPTQSSPDKPVPVPFTVPACP